MKNHIRHIVIERASENDPLAVRARELLPEAGVTIADDPRALFGTEPGGKGTLFLMRHRGSFVKDFPSTPGSPPCGEKYIISMLNCCYNCSYCYLQSYLEHGRLVLFTDLKRMMAEIEHSISHDSPKRITTGEMSDSLALDELTGMTLTLLPLFEGTETLLEVRTKSARIDHILSALEGRDRGANLVITWTLGPPEMIEHEESGTASLQARLEAMGRALRAGIRVGVRLDPVVPHYADRESYGSLLEEIARRVEGHGIDRLEIGVLRFPPDLIEKVRERNPQSMLLRGEYLRDREGKLRLYRPSRIALYREIARLVRDILPGVPIELSMESRDVWEDAEIALPAR